MQAHHHIVHGRSFIRHACPPPAQRLHISFLLRFMTPRNKKSLANPYPLLRPYLSLCSIRSRVGSTRREQELYYLCAHLGKKCTG